MLSVNCEFLLKILCMYCDAMSLKDSKASFSSRIGEVLKYSNQVCGTKACLEHQTSCSS